MQPHYSVIVKRIENEKAKFAFGKILNEKLEIPFTQMNNYLAIGKVIKKDLDKSDANELLNTLSIPGVKLVLKHQMTKTQRKLLWVIPLILTLTVLVPLSYICLNNPNRKIHRKCLAKYTESRSIKGCKKCLSGCLKPHCIDTWLWIFEGLPECYINPSCEKKCNCVIEYMECFEDCGDDEACHDVCSDQNMSCIAGYVF